MPIQSAELRDFLVSSSDNLKLALEKNPNLINMQDENGRTILHYVALLGLSASRTRTIEFLDLLFTKPNLDLTVRDNNGDTAVHLAALACSDKTIYEVTFPFFIEKAIEKKFNFNITGRHGLTVLQIATMETYSDSRRQVRYNNVKKLLDHAGEYDVGLNSFSKDGRTALYFATSEGLFEEAKTLLDAGASPIKAHKEEDIPLNVVNRYLEELAENDSDERHVLNLRLQLSELKKQMLLHPEVKNVGEIRKNARILDQGQRSPQSLFSILPKELLTKIASSSRIPGTHSDEEAEALASKHLQRPKK
jgi:ankyrin repeat protein